MQFRVLLLLIILAAAILFCHSAISLCLLLFLPRNANDANGESPLPSMVGPGGFTIPRSPIRVALARDEEAVGEESEATKVPPPAYGLWRESVVSSVL